MKLENKKSQIRIGDLLRRTRKSLGYTQEEVAEMLDLASRYISDIERDKTKGSVDTLVKLCNIYHITPTYVLQDYLELTEDYKIDPNIIGFYELSEHDKQVITELIRIYE
ncbi:MAG: helix-turn-helix transcriptional regulator [Clostridia bacterium]|nr:helix-turn-helix transcriptional regulator [Clostridia bacterium]